MTIIDMRLSDKLYMFLKLRQLTAQLIKSYFRINILIIRYFKINPRSSDIVQVFK
jgi:hypothetical protein